MARQQGDLLSQFQYDGQGRLLAQRVDRKEGSVFLRRYHYDDSGNLTRLEDTRRGTRTYQYDPLDRLTAVRGELAEYFVHDPAGNLLAQSGLHGDPRDVRVEANRLLMHGDSHYDYDRFGNQVSERRGHGQQLVTHYHYDSQHRLACVDLPDGRQARYRYDAFGRRVSKAVGDTVTTFIWQGERLLAEHCQGRWRSYVYEPGGFRPMVMLLRDGDGPAETLDYHLDHLGTPQELTSSSGRVRWSARYRAYGHVLRLDVDHIDNPLRFQGQYYDEETGLHYNRHRYYNPQTGRYLTPDPIGLAGGVNGYLYGVNPTGWVDPLGLSNCPGEESCTILEKAHRTDDVRAPIDPYDGSKYGHAFTRHGKENTRFLKSRAEKMNRANGQWLDDFAAAEFVDSVPGVGKVVVDLPSHVPARLVNPDGTFSPVFKVTIVRNGLGRMITAFPGEMP